MTNGASVESEDPKRPAGYLRLQRRHNLPCLPHHVESYIAGSRETHTSSGRTEEIYPAQYWPGETDFDHLEFALKYEGMHLGLLRELLPRMQEAEVTAYLQSKPTSIYARRIWFLYEAFSGKRLDLPTAQGNYVSLLDEDDYYTGAEIRSQRHRVNVNLPGTIEFSPMVRRTKVIRQYEAKKLEELCRKTIEAIPPHLYARALQYMFVKETKSSYAIERETPDQKRTQRFVDVLQEAGKRDYLTKNSLVSLQQAIVEPRYANKDWREDQNYVSESVSITDERMHFIAPKPQDIRTLMEEYLNASKKILEQKEIHPVIAAAVIAYAFVFLHPFLDGNGRIHRFLIHYVLSVQKFAPEGLVFPISATMLSKAGEYDASLESFSKPLLPLIDYKLESTGRMTVFNETINLYRYVDFTFIVETLFRLVEETIIKEMPTEILFLKNYDEARKLMRDVVDMPNRHADLFVRLCLQKGGKLSKSKRTIPEYAVLSDEEVAKLEAAISEAFKQQKMQE